MEDFSAERLRAVRVELRLTQIDFADKLGISLRALRYFESGHRQPRSNHLKRICEVTGKPLDFFFSSEGTPA